MKIIILFISLLCTPVIGSKFPCNTSDTSYSNGDTLVTKFRCHENKKPKSVTHFRNGKFDGLYEGWDSSGRKTIEKMYVNDKLHGAVKSWDDKGTLLDILNYKMGKPVGTHKYWYSPGKPERFTDYDSLGRKNGLEMYWYKNGFLRDSAVYKTDTMVEEKTFFKNGKLSSHVFYNGTVIVRTMYKDSPGSDEIVSRRTQGKFFNYQGKLVSQIIDGTGTAIWYDSLGREPFIEKFFKGAPEPACKRRTIPGLDCTYEVLQVK